MIVHRADPGARGKPPFWSRIVVGAKLMESVLPRKLFFHVNHLFDDFFCVLSRHGDGSNASRVRLSAFLEWLSCPATVEAVLKQKEPQARKRRGGRQPTKPANRGARLFVGRSLCGYLPEDGDHLGEHVGPPASKCGTAQKEVDMFSDGRRTWPFGGMVGSHTKKCRG